jgi:hypothetical protein
MSYNGKFSAKSIKKTYKILMKNLKIIYTFKIHEISEFWPLFEMK